MATDVKSREEEDVLEEYATITPKPKIWRQRLPFALTFLLGLLIGIAGTCVAPPIVKSVLNTAKLSPTAHWEDSGDLDISGPDGLNLTKLEFLKYPLSEDPICGKDRHEAKAAGCHYDLLATRWYNDDCYHPDVMQEFFDEMEFETFYQDPEFTTPASKELALSGDWDLLWPVHSFHIMHCLYQFRRLHKAILEHRSIDDDVLSYGHTLHCTRMIMNWPNEIRWGKNTTTIIDSRVSYCLPAKL